MSDKLIEETSDKLKNFLDKAKEEISEFWNDVKTLVTKYVKKFNELPTSVKLLIVAGFVVIIIVAIDSLFSKKKGK